MARRAQINLLEDSRIGCYSAMTTISMGTYLDKVHDSFKSRGGIDGQRDQLRTTSAIRIRKRMVDDIIEGAVLPPIVIGVVLQLEDFRKVKSLSKTNLRDLLASTDSDNLSIIDGMQRTTALLEAVERNPLVRQKETRIEYWIADSTNSLIYRMLVLNTGQVPWNLRRQVEVVFRSLISEIKSKVSAIDILKADGQRRRSKGGQFQANEVIELFLVFGARKEKIDIKEKLADEFTRLDFMEVASEKNFTSLFCDAFSLLAKIDIAFDAFKGKKTPESASRFISGKDIFSSQPACVGFITAIAIEIFGRPGIQRGIAETELKHRNLQKNISEFLSRLEKMPDSDLESFLALQTLNEAIGSGRSMSSVGDAEREFFVRAFQVLIEEQFRIDNMTPCWRAY